MGQVLQFLPPYCIRPLTTSDFYGQGKKENRLEKNSQRAWLCIPSG
jgi:hypothetical protein